MLETKTKHRNKCTKFQKRNKVSLKSDLPGSNSDSMEPISFMKDENVFLEVTWYCISCNIKQSNPSCMKKTIGSNFYCNCQAKVSDVMIKM